MNKAPARKAKNKAPEQDILAMMAEPIRPREMVEVLEDEATGWIDGNTMPIGDLSTLEIGIARTVLVLRSAAQFIASHSKRR